MLPFRDGLKDFIIRHSLVDIEYLATHKIATVFKVWTDASINYASAKTLACPAIALFRATADAALLIKKIAHFRIRHSKVLTYAFVCCAFSSVRALSLNVIYIFQMA